MEFAGEEQTFSVKPTTFLGRQVPILVQNQNGPCALLAIVNVLLLRNVIEISVDAGTVTLEDIVGLVANRLFEANGERSQGQDEIGAQMRQALSDAVEHLSVLKHGLDVNVRFDSPKFEFTSAEAVFDLLDMSLVHGWIYDPEERETAAVLRSRGYNELVLASVSSTASSEDEETAKSMHEGSVIEDFLRRTATQLTYYGLAQLHATLRENELAVLYRNLHFSTLFKYRGDLYVLVTDLGYRHEKGVVWEKLDSIDGDTEFVTADFRPSPNNQESTANADVEQTADYLVALQLQKDDNDNDNFLASEQQGATTSTPIDIPGTAASESQEEADYRAALELQFADEEPVAEQASPPPPALPTSNYTPPAPAASRPNQRRPPPPPKRSSSSCTIS